MVRPKPPGRSLEPASDGAAERNDRHAVAPAKAGAKADRIRLTAALRRNSSRSFTVQPELDPIWAACGRLGVPVLIHAGEPAAFFDPIDFTNERWRTFETRDEYYKNALALVPGLPRAGFPQ